MWILTAVLAVIDGALGYLLRQLHAWVNYLIAILAGGLLLVNLGLLGSSRDQAVPGANAGSCVGMLILAALLYYSVQNMKMHRELRSRRG